MVLDTDRDSVVGDIPDTPSVHGVALVPELGRGFTSNGRDSSVSIFDLETLAVRGRVSVTGRNPDAIFYEPASRRVFTLNGGSANATALDPSSGAVVGTLKLGGKPEYATADGTGRVFVNIEDKSEVVAFDPQTRLALSSNGEGTLTVVREESPDRFSVVGTVPTERGARTIALDARTHRVYTATARFRAAPAPTSDRPRPRPPTVPGTFTILVLDR
jgi:DNA-binding beta-propeller fold protein YncE